MKTKIYLIKLRERRKGGREELEYVYAGHTIVMYLKSKIVRTNFRTISAKLFQSYLKKISSFKLCSLVQSKINATQIASKTGVMTHCDSY